jgi:hypothetical protein
MISALIGGPEIGAGVCAGAVTEEHGDVEGGTVGAPFSGFVHELFMP